MKGFYIAKIKNSQVVFNSLADKAPALQDSSNKENQPIPRSIHIDYPVDLTENAKEIIYNSIFQNYTNGNTHMPYESYKILCNDLRVTITPLLREFYKKNSNSSKECDYKQFIILMQHIASQLHFNIVSKLKLEVKDNAKLINHLNEQIENSESKYQKQKNTMQSVMINKGIDPNKVSQNANIYNLQSIIHECQEKLEKANKIRDDLCRHLIPLEEADKVQIENNFIREYICSSTKFEYSQHATENKEMKTLPLNEEDASDDRNSGLNYVESRKIGSIQTLSNLSQLRCQDYGIEYNQSENVEEDDDINVLQRYAGYSHTLRKPEHSNITAQHIREESIKTTILQRVTQIQEIERKQNEQV